MRRTKLICLYISVCLTISVLTSFPAAEAWTFWRYNTGDDVADVGISADGNYVAAVTRWTPANVFLFDRNGGLKWKKTLPYQSANSIAISGNGSYIVVGTSYQKVLLLDTSGNVLWTKDLTTQSLYDVDISSDGRYIATGGYDNTVYFYDNAGVQIWNFTAGGWVQGVSISSDGEYTAAGSWDEFLYLFNRDGELLWSMNTTSPVYAVASSPEGGFIAAGNSHGNVSLFDNFGNLLWNIYLRNVDAISVSAGGEYIAVANRYDDKVTLLDRTGAVLWDWRVDDYANDVDITSDGQYVVAASDDKCVYLLENIKPSKITCEYTQAQIILGESNTIFGSVDPPYSGVEIVLNYTKPDNSTTTRTAISGADGSFSDTIAPDMTGMWSVRAWWGGNTEYMGAQNSTRFLVTATRNTPLKMGKSRMFFDYFESPESYSYPI